MLVLAGAYQAGSEPSLKSTILGFCGWERTVALERPPVPFLRKGLGCFFPDYAILNKVTIYDYTNYPFWIEANYHLGEFSAFYFILFRFCYIIFWM